MKDDELVAELLALMEKTSADWTCTFRALTTAGSQAEAAAEIRRWCSQGTERGWAAWLAAYGDALSAQGVSWGSAARLELMASANPAVVPREWLLSRAARSAEAGDLAEVPHFARYLGGQRVGGQGCTISRRCCVVRTLELSPSCISEGCIIVRFLTPILKPPRSYEC